MFIVDSAKRLGPACAAPGKLAVLLLSISAAFHFAVDCAAEDAPRAADSEHRIDELILKLDSNRFRERNAAMHQLMSLKGSAIREVVQATADSNPEVANRALHILVHHWNNGDWNLQALIEREEEKLAQIDHRVASELRRRLAPARQSNPIRLPKQLNIPVIVQRNLPPVRVQVQPPPPPRPLTPAEKAKQKKIEGYDRILEKLQTQIRRFEIKQANAKDPKQFNSIIKSLEKQKAQIQ